MIGANTNSDKLYGIIEVVKFINDKLDVQIDENIIEQDFDFIGKGLRHPEFISVHIVIGKTSITFYKSPEAARDYFECIKRIRVPCL